MNLPHLLRSARTFVLAAAMLTATAALAHQPFDAAAFFKAQAEGRPILVSVYATWCPTCRQQKNVLAKLEDDRSFAGLVRFEVDFDQQADALKMLNVKNQSTLIAYRGSTERGRSTFDTDPQSIRALVSKAFPPR